MAVKRQEMLREVEEWCEAVGKVVFVCLPQPIHIFCISTNEQAFVLLLANMSALEEDEVAYTPATEDRAEAGPADDEDAVWCLFHGTRSNHTKELAKLKAVLAQMEDAASKIEETGKAGGSTDAELGISSAVLFICLLCHSL